MIELAQSEDPYVLRWSMEPKEFPVKLDEETAQRHFLLKKDGTGLRLTYVGGTVILLR